MASLRVYGVSKQVVARLTNEVLAQESARGLDSFVSLKSTEYARDHSARVDLEVKHEYQGIDSNKPPDEQETSGPVTRDMVDGLFDLLGIFPRTGEIPNGINHLLLRILSLTSSIREMVRHCEDGRITSNVEGDLRSIEEKVRRLEERLKLLL